MKRKPFSVEQIVATLKQIELGLPLAQAARKNQTLTPNPDVIYLMPFYDTRKGPVVLEIPPATVGSITGSIDDGWQTAIEDVGPAGADQGQGGKYLILARQTHGSSLWTSAQAWRTVHNQQTC